MFCGRCGANNPDGNKFCENCGAGLNGKEMEASAYDAALARGQENHPAPVPTGYAGGQGGAYAQAQAGPAGAPAAAMIKQKALDPANRKWLVMAAAVVIVIIAAIAIWNISNDMTGKWYYSSNASESNAVELLDDGTYLVGGDQGGVWYKKGDNLYIDGDVAKIKRIAGHKVFVFEYGSDEDVYCRGEDVYDVENAMDAMD